jgi:NAD(P)-dependent dehydrogenase (short-subunit alcohol dehydrogenase family)
MTFACLPRNFALCTQRAAVWLRYDPLAAVESVVSQIREKFGCIDVVFANAGMDLAAPLEAVTEDQIDTQFDVSFTVQNAAPLRQRWQYCCDDVVPERARHTRPVDPVCYESGSALIGSVVGR